MKIPAELVLVVFLLLTVFPVYATCQTTPSSAPQPPQASTPARTNVDETFDLNISERRFTRENFEASTAVGTDGDQNLNLQIGVGLTAGRIDVLMRNVHERVRFQGTLDRILQILSNRRVSTPAPSP